MNTEKQFNWTDKEKKQRAFGYALSLVAFQEVGMGEDETLWEAREIVQRIRDLCLKETGIFLESYPTEFIRENKDLIKNQCSIKRLINKNFKISN